MKEEQGTYDTKGEIGAFWERRRATAYQNPWEVISYPGSEEKISGVAVFPRKKFLRRTPRRWCELALFYLVFYSVLICFSLLLYQIFSVFVNSPEKPMYFDIIEKFRSILIYPPLKESDFENNNCSSLPYIVFNKSGNNPIFRKISQAYSRLVGKGVACNFDSTPDRKKPCIFDTTVLGPCLSGTTPCFLIRPTRIIDWVPDVYNETKDLPKNFPADLKSIFTSTMKKERKAIWLSCRGHQPRDRRNIVSMTYHPATRSFPAYYYPYNRNPNYMDPLVAVQLNIKPKSKVAIECKIWANNIDPDDSEVGALQFLFFTSDN